MTTAPSRPLILVVDDNPINRTVIIHMVTRLGCDYHAVNDGAAAVASFKAHDYDLILMDVAMPIMGGREATRLIRADEQRPGSHIPILGLSGFALEEDRKLGLAAGMNEYIAKPIDLHQLSRALQRWLPGRIRAAWEPREGID